MENTTEKPKIGLLDTEAKIPREGETIGAQQAEKLSEPTHMWGRLALQRARVRNLAAHEVQCVGGHRFRGAVTGAPAGRH